jgi:hypothetical protein
VAAAASAIRVSPTELLRLRLWTQRVDPVGSADVAGTVRHLVAVQAQDFAQSLWAVGARSRGTKRSEVLAALESGAVVRTLPMRGTLHLVAAEDLRWMLALTSERMLKSASTRFSVLGLDRATLDAAAEVARAALTGGRSLTRDEFMKLLESSGISTAGQRGYHIIFCLSQLVLVCWGPPRGTQQALVLVDEWIPRTAVRERADALSSFALRYFASHGPATERDFAWWTKLTLADARAAISALGSQLTSLEHDGARYWIATTELEAATGSRRGSAVQALPGFDEYLLGYQDRSLPLSTEHSHRIIPGNNGIFLPTIVAKGRVVGTWRRNPTSKVAEIAPEHFESATSTQLAGFARAAKRYSAFSRG